MKAVVCTKYGAPDVLQIQDVSKPTPKDNEVLIKVHAGIVTPSDCAFRKGDPFIVRLMFGLRKPRLPIQGVEFAGEVEAAGREVTQFQPGDQVVGMSGTHFGAHAEYVCLAENGTIIPKPATWTYEEIIGMYDGSPTAFIFLRDVAKLRRGQKILINGASGAVGAAAVQLAKHYGAEVTGVCSTANLDMVKALGADHVIDYTREDFTKSGQRYDVIFDAVGKRSYGECKGALTEQGAYMTTVPTLRIVRDMLWTSLRRGKKAKFTTAGLKQNQETLGSLNGLIEEGKLRPVIDRCYPLEGIADAHAYVDTERKKGSVVIVVA